VSEISEEQLHPRRAEIDFNRELTGNADSVPILTFNWIGRLLGWKCITLEGNSLVVFKKEAAAEVHSLKSCINFATLSGGVLGKTLQLRVEDSLVRHKFLKSSLAAQFLESLNSHIVLNVNRYVVDTAAEFDDLVIHNYPRDSRIERISLMCKAIHDKYSAEKELWDTYLDSSSHQNLQRILQFWPVDRSMLREHHEKYQLVLRARFFDSVESHPLTDEQRLGVLRSNDRNMVLAAAGTGKTSVIVSKALDLIDRKLAEPEEILILAYNKSAAQEVAQRMADKANKSGIVLEVSPQISTFHALGRMLLREAKIPTYMSVFTEDDLRLKQWITGWLEKYLSENRDRLLSFISLFPEPVNPFDFKNQAEYERYIRDNEFRTLNGERVKGYQELLIANFLYLNDIQYSYEAPYVSKRRIEVGFDYRPDFYLIGGNAYIEHFGIDRNGKTRPDIDPVKYNEDIKRKRSLHFECGTDLIETFHYEWIEDALTKGLQQKLLTRGIQCRPIPPEQVLEKLRSEGRITKWSELLKKALQSVRVEQLNSELILQRLKKGKIAKAREFADLISALHEEYVRELQRQSSIDFDDMIIRAIHVLKEDRFVPKWKYVLVDEFQDISAARMDFVQAILDKGPDPSLTVVGDDWQSIYRFSGGKLELTTRFGEMVGSYTSTSLQKTFRYNNSIANTAGRFIMENPEQYQKDIKTHDQVDKSQVYLLDDKINLSEGLFERTVEVVRKIREKDTDGSVAVIARYNYLLADVKTNLSKARLQTNVKLWTFHKSKGLEADYVVLIGFSQGRLGFPNENKEEAIIEALLPSIDGYPHSEERRLMYVGLTRARKKVYIVANPSAPSDFVVELLAPKHELNIVSSAFQEQYRKIFKCPNCVDGYLKKIKALYGEFYVCSTGLGCKVGKARVCNLCGAPSVDRKTESVCNNMACCETIRLCEKCGRPMKKRSGRNGEFWGCSGYGIKDDQCTFTSNN
jgi:DNA helicase-4